MEAVMIRIIRNHLKLSALLLFLIFLVSNIAYLFFARLRAKVDLPFPGAIQLAIATSSVMILALFLREEQGKAQVLYRSLPISHSKIVSAMYALVIFVFLANLSYGFSLQLINAYLGPWIPNPQRSEIIHRFFAQFNDGFAIEHTILSYAIALSIITSVSMPLIVRYGSIWRILMGFLVFMWTWSTAVDRLLRFSLNTSLFLGRSRWLFIATTMMLISLTLSWRLSVYLYGQRDL
jgi:hypothetical protein